MKEGKRPTTDLATVESQRNDLTAEEFPEGAYGSSIESESIAKSVPWREDQRPPNSFGYENQQLHVGLPRDYPGEDVINEQSGGSEPLDK